MSEPRVSWPNTRLEALVGETGMSRAGLATRVNSAAAAIGAKRSYDHRSVGRWFRGQRPRREVQDLIRSVLQTALNRPVTLADIGMSEDAILDDSIAALVRGSTSFWFEDRKSETVQGSGPIRGGDAVLPVWNWENGIGWADISRDAGPRVGSIDVVRLRAARAHYEQMYRVTGGLATAPRVVEFLVGSVVPLLQGSFDDAVGRDLARAAGGLVSIAGISRYDADDHAAAQRYLHQALRFAKASGDRAFGAYVVALLVNQALGLEAYKEAVELSDVGLRAARACASPALASDLLAMKAKALAHLGEKPAALDSADEALAATSIQDGDEPPEASYVQAGHVVGQLSEALLVLGDLKNARTFMNQALQGGSHSRASAHRWATAANIYAAGRDYEQAANAALSMLEHARGMESRRLWRRFGEVRRTLAGSSRAEVVVKAVVEIDDALLLSV